MAGSGCAAFGVVSITGETTGETWGSTAADWIGADGAIGSGGATGVGGTTGID
jgi:hypothetical protein